jgi:hypothetical protein
MLPIRFCFALILGVNCQTPIPNKPTGWSYDPKGTGFQDDAIEVEIFLDLQCPDCLMAYPTLKQMADHYGPQVLLISNQEEIIIYITIRGSCSER